MTSHPYAVPFKYSLAKPLLVSCLVVLLSGCGFTLRGSDTLSAKFTSLQLNLESRNSEFARSLIRTIENAGVAVELIDEIDLESDIPVLMVSDEQATRRVVTVNPAARAAQYELLLVVTAAFGQSSNVYFGPDELQVEKVYFEDIENIAGSQEEIEIITAEMRRELVAQLIRRIEATELTL